MQRGARSRLWAIARGRCPRCLRGRVFKGTFAMYEHCPDCGVLYAREEGYFTGAMIVSYTLAVPILAVLVLAALLLTQWPFGVALLVGLLFFLLWVPAIFRWSRVIWLHLDRLIDSDPAEERYAPGHPLHR